MMHDVEGGHEEISSRHPLAALPFGAILTFLGVRRRRGPRDGGRSATTVAERAPAVTSRRGMYALLAAEGVSQVGNTIVIVRDALGHCPKDLQQLVGAAIRPIFRASSLEEARRLLGETVTHLEARVPKVARLLLEAEPDLLAFYGFPAAHHSKLRSTNPLERVDREIGRRTDVVGVFPNDAALLRLAGSLLIEQNDVRV
jgi:mutator family transposase